MVANKHIEKIILAVMAIAVVLCLLAVANADTLTAWLGGTGVTMEYESKLFDTDEPMTVDIRMDEEEWERMLSNAASEEYYVCDVTINGKTIHNVAIRPKGNTSLSSIAMDPNSDRFSLKLEFDHFVDGQTCCGLDKLILNNNYADATNMKEAIIYDMYQYLGADASLYNYAKVSVNGEYWGVYLALEAVEQSFMLRNYGTQDGELYKPDSMDINNGVGGNSADGGSGSGFGGMTPPSGGSSFPGGGSSGPGGMTPPSGGSNSPSGGFDGSFSFGGGSMPDMSTMPDMGSFDASNMPDMSNIPDMSSIPDMGSFDASGVPSNSAADAEADKGDARPSGRGGGFSMGGSGANLNYTDDELDSYSTIWDSEVTKTGKSDHRKVVTALKNISEGTDLETYLDVDNVLKYMAVHTFAVNMDSLSGSMAHNYYLYEYDGQLNIIPWDYNLSLGGMSMGSSSATDVVNDAIDTPFSGTHFFDALLENEEYLARYHAYLQQLVDEYVNGGRFDEVYTGIRNEIDSLVETDPTAFYTYEEYETAAETLYEIIKLRAVSISGQLDGTIPSTDAGQRQDISALIDASHLDITVMGQFNMGGVSSRSDSEEGESSSGFDFSQIFGGGFSFGGFGPGSGKPESFDASSLPEGFDASSLPEGFDVGSMPSMGGFAGASAQTVAQTKAARLLSYSLSLVAALAGLLLVKGYQRQKTKRRIA